MCVIAVSRPGSPHPSEADFRSMWIHNPHGAGYMFARDGRVIIHKGFMLFDDFMRAIRNEHFTDEDSVVYHFRISTQAGKTPEMTHPFPLTKNLSYCELLDLSCSVGIAHNGIIPITSDTRETRYSDTALFITKYLSRLIRNTGRLADQNTLDRIETLGGFSRFAIMDGSGTVTTIGRFTESNGYLVSNRNHIHDIDFSGYFTRAAVNIGRASRN